SGEPAQPVDHFFSSFFNCSLASSAALVLGYLSTISLYFSLALSSLPSLTNSLAYFSLREASCSSLSSLVSSDFLGGSLVSGFFGGSLASGFVGESLSIGLAGSCPAG